MVFNAVTLHNTHNDQPLKTLKFQDEKMGSGVKFVPHPASRQQIAQRVTGRDSLGTACPKAFTKNGHHRSWGGKEALYGGLRFFC